MRELYELKEMLCKELEEYGKKGELTTGSLDVVDKLAHTIKNLCKIIEAYEDEEYSSEGGSYRGGSYAQGGRGGSNRGGSYAQGGSYARGGRRGGGRRGGANQYGSYAMEGYSRDEEMVMQLRELMQDAPDEKTRMEFQKFIQKIEQSM